MPFRQIQYMSSTIYPCVPVIHIWTFFYHPFWKTTFTESTSSNSSLSVFYNEVMTFNATDVNVTCCNLDGTPMSVTCGQGLSCAASCFSLEATLCPSHNCEACGTFEDEEEGQRRGWSYVTQASSALAFCPGPGHWCNVWRTKGCCFHPVCQRQKQKECSWLRYFVGRC